MSIWTILLTLQRILCALRNMMLPTAMRTPVAHATLLLVCHSHGRTASCDLVMVYDIRRLIQLLCRALAVSRRMGLRSRVTRLQARVQSI